ncbi:uncharacterized protein LOC144578690 [Callithrix jacchus]
MANSSSQVYKAQNLQLFDFLELSHLTQANPSSLLEDSSLPLFGDPAKTSPKVPSSQESPAIFPPGFLPPPSPQASCCPEKSPPSLLCSAQQQQAANHCSRKARQASAYPEPTRNPLSHLSSLPRDGQPILSSYDTLPALCPCPVHPPYKTLLPQLRSRSQPRSPSFPGLPAGPNKPELGFQLSSCYLGSGTGQGSTRGSYIWCRNPGRRVASPPSDPLPPATSPALLQFGLSTPDQNRRALDLLTAERGGTCIFLQEECCYYINESGLVETRIESLQKLKTNLQSQKFSAEATAWWSSSMYTLLSPLLGPLVAVCLILLIAPCFLQFIQRRFQELTRVTIHQMLLQPHPEQVQETDLSLNIQAP